MREFRLWGLVAATLVVKCSGLISGHVFTNSRVSLRRSVQGWCVVLLKKVKWKMEKK